MYVCVCNAVSDRQIRQAVTLGITNLQALKDGLGVASCCGACEPCAEQILAEEISLTRENCARRHV